MREFKIVEKVILYCCALGLTFEFFKIEYSAIDFQITHLGLIIASGLFAMAGAWIEVKE